MSYERFRDTIAATLKAANKPMTWTEVRTTAKLPQPVPNNKWVRQMEKDIGLVRWKDTHGIMQWGFKKESWFAEEFLVTNADGSGEGSS